MTDSDRLPEIFKLDETGPEARPRSERAGVFTCGSCGSALDVAWGLIRRGLMRPWDSVLAADQTAGRGQMRRRWISGPGNVYAALLLPPSLGGNAASVQFGWLAVRALRELLARSDQAGAEGLRLKWPNDIIWSGRKLGGILLEEKGENLLAGIGINLLHSPENEQMRPDFAFPAGNLRQLAPHCPFVQNLSAQSLWLSLVSIMRFWYETKVLVAGGGIAPSLIEPELAFLGETVLVSDGAAGLSTGEAYGLPAALSEGAAVGKLLGLGPDGQLRLGTANGEALFASGSVYPLGGPS